NVAAVDDLLGAVRGLKLIRLHAGLARHGKRNGVVEWQLLIERATEKSPYHFETPVIEFEFLGQIRTVYKQVQMIGVGQGRIARIAPAFGVEMEAKNKIGMQLEVHAHRAASNLAVAVE